MIALLLFGACAGFGCAKASPELNWLNPPARIEAASQPGGQYEPTLDDPALSAGVAVGGDLRFELRAPGPHLVEVFLVTDQWRSSFVLESGGAAIDTQHQVKPGPDRLRPRSGRRYITLLGIVEGGLMVRSDSPRYVLSAVRWTAQKDFESTLAPRWRERARYWLANTAAGTKRRNYLQQLYDRLALSRQPDVRREAVVGQARAMYWVTAENHEPREIDRTRELFIEGLKIAPDDPLLRQMISASCLGINAPADRMPRGPFCGQVWPVPWQVEVPAPPPGAPAWAIEQRKLARRMDAITRWWLEKRQQPNGELGGGWGDDVEILRHWGPQALGLGSESAVTGIRRLADGLWSSGTLAGGYDRRISDVEHSSEPSTDTVPLRMAILPEDPEGRARLKQTGSCAFNWIAPQPDGAWLPRVLVQLHPVRPQARARARRPPEHPRDGTRALARLPDARPGDDRAVEAVGRGVGRRHALDRARQAGRHLPLGGALGRRLLPGRRLRAVGQAERRVGLLSVERRFARGAHVAPAGRARSDGRGALAGGGRRELPNPGTLRSGAGALRADRQGA